MNSTANYQLSNFLGLFSHGQVANVLRDHADDVFFDHETLQLNAEVKSGDYFVTLATRLDSLGRQLADPSTRSAIEDIVSDLIYLQDNYAIKKDDHNHSSTQQ